MKKILLVALLAICLQLSFVKCQRKPIPDSNPNKSIYVYNASDYQMVISWKCYNKIFLRGLLEERPLTCMFKNCYNKSNCDVCMQVLQAQLNFKTNIQLWVDCVRIEDIKFKQEEEKRIKKEEEKKIESKYLTLTPDQQYIAYRCFEANGQKEDLLMLQKMCIFNNCYNGESHFDCALKCLEQNQNNDLFLDYIANWMKCTINNEGRKKGAQWKASNDCADRAKFLLCDIKKSPECQTFSSWECLARCKQLSLDECNNKYKCEITQLNIFDNFSKCFADAEIDFFKS